MYRNLLGIGAVFFVALVLVGITFSASTERPADFRFINGAEPKSLDPHVITGQPDGRIVDALFEGLTFRDPKTLKPQPGCAQSWEISEDKKTYTFHIRKDAKWSDGRPITAHDFVYSWRRLQDPGGGYEYAYILHPVKWAEIYNTYGGHADRLLGPIKKGLTLLEALAELRRANPGGVAAVDWQKFLGKEQANDLLKGSPDALIQAVVTQREGTLNAERLLQIEASFKLEGERRRALHASAVEHFGVDQGMFAKDDYTFVVELNAPTPYFLDLTAFYSAVPVPGHLLERLAKEKQESGANKGIEDWFLPGNIVSNGPFCLEAWRVNEKIRLVRSGTYWGRDEVRLEVVDALPIDNVNTALNVYLTGGADWTTRYPVSIVGALRDRPDFKRTPGMVVYYYRFNTTRPPFDDVRVRKAFAMAINRQTIVEYITKKGEVPAFRLTPPGLGAYDAPADGFRYDPEAARALLKEAGYGGGVGIPKLTLLYNTDDLHKTIAEEVEAQLKKELKVEIKALNQEWQMYQATTLALDYDLARAGWIGDYVDPNTFLDMWISNGGNNQTGWSNALYDALIAHAANIENFLPDADKLIPKFKEPDKARALVAAMRATVTADALAEAGAALRLHLFREAESILFQDGFPVIPMHFYVVSSMVRPHVRGWHLNPQDIHPLRGIWIDREAR